MKRITAKELKCITRSELYAIFVKTVMNSTDARLDAFTESEVLDDDSKVIGKLKLIYSYINDEYITFLVTFVDQNTMRVFCMENGELVAEFNRNPETEGWSNLKVAELDGQTVATMADVLTTVVTRLKKRLKL